VEEGTPNQANAATQEQFGIQNIYIKDVSFESPHSPQIFSEQWKPQLELEMSNNINKLNFWLKFIRAVFSRSRVLPKISCLICLIAIAQTFYFPTPVKRFLV